MIEETPQNIDDSQLSGWQRVNARHPTSEVATDARWRITPQLLQAGDVAVLLSNNDRVRAQTLQHAAAVGVAAVYSLSPEVDHPLTDLPVYPLPSKQPRRWFAELSAIGHDLDRQCPPLYFITGTDGKTTTAWLLQFLLGPGAAYVGTIGFHDGTALQTGRLTTPAADALHDFLAHLPVNCPGVAIEASSIGLHQHRLAGLQAEAVVLTNVGSDHLDYHGSQAAYERAKLSLFELLQPHGRAILPGDDPIIDRAQATLADICPTARAFSVGRWSGDLRLHAPSAPGGTWQLSDQHEQHELLVPLLGEYNQRNAAQAALAVAGDRWCDVLPRLAQAPIVPGRMEEAAPGVYIDYAHTPQALHAVLSAVRQHYPDHQVIAVAGCGGDRDAAKRPAMGAALRLADIAFITSDNPRSEAPSQIAADMLRDCDPDLIAWQGEATADDDRPLRVIHDRESALRAALKRQAKMTANDQQSIIVIFGKGHETQQMLASGPVPWHDATAVQAILDDTDLAAAMQAHLETRDG